MHKDLSRVRPEDDGLDTLFNESFNGMGIQSSEPPLSLPKKSLKKSMCSLLPGL